MKKNRWFYLFSVYLFLTGCREENSEQNRTDDSTVIINKIENHITQKNTSLGCKDNRTEVCTEEKSSGAFILNILAKEHSQQGVSNTLSIKENLNRSLEEISKEEKRTKQLKEELVIFVNSTQKNRGKELEQFINKVEEEKEAKKLGNVNRIAQIKDNLNDLILSEEPIVKSKEVKRKLENLMSNIKLSEKTLSQTKETLKTLVDTVGNRGGESDKKFVNAIIEDVSTHKIRIVEEKENYFIITVQEGDNLSALAQRYYSDTDKFKLIYEANKNEINEKYEIYPGSKLLIPKI